MLEKENEAASAEPVEVEEIREERTYRATTYSTISTLIKASSQGQRKLRNGKKAGDPNVFGVEECILMSRVALEA